MLPEPPGRTHRAVGQGQRALEGGDNRPAGLQWAALVLVLAQATLRWVHSLKRVTEWGAVMMSHRDPSSSARGSATGTHPAVPSCPSHSQVGLTALSSVGAGVEGAPCSGPHTMSLSVTGNKVSQPSWTPACRWHTYLPSRWHTHLTHEELRVLGGSTDAPEASGQQGTAPGLQSKSRDCQPMRCPLGALAAAQMAAPLGGCSTSGQGSMWTWAAAQPVSHPRAQGDSAPRPAGEAGRSEKPG